MAYENRGVIVIIVKRVLSKPSVKVPEHGQHTRASQNRPIQTILQDILGSSDRRTHRYILPCGMRQAPLIIFTEWIDDYLRRRSVTHTAIPRQKFHTPQFSHGPVIGKRRPPGLPAACPTRLGVCIVNE